jgi:sugar lactone lactonase YvrE
VHLFDIKARKYTALVQVGLGRATGSLPARENTGGQAASGTNQVTSEPAEEIQRPGATLESPVAVCWAGEDLWVADSKLHALAVFERGGAGRWIAFDELQRPSGMAYCPTNQLCYVSDAGAHRILAFDNKGRPIVEFGSRGDGPGQFNCPSHIAYGPDGSLVVADSLNFRVQRLSLDGSPLACFGRKGNAAGDLALPKGVAVDANGSIWVVDAQFENVQAFTPAGELLMALGKEGHKPGEFWLPAGICVDGQNRMWIADRENGRVQVFAILP